VLSRSKILQDQIYLEIPLNKMQLPTKKTNKNKEIQVLTILKVQLLIKQSQISINLNMLKDQKILQMLQ
jgi:hypothetical protein